MNRLMVGVGPKRKRESGGTSSPPQSRPRYASLAYLSLGGRLEAMLRKPQSVQIVCSLVEDSDSGDDWRVAYEGLATTATAAARATAFLKKCRHVRVLAAGKCLAEFKRVPEAHELQTASALLNQSPDSKEVPKSIAKPAPSESIDATRTQRRKKRKKVKALPPKRGKVTAVSAPGCAQVNYRDSRASGFPMAAGQSESNRRRH